MTSTVDREAQSRAAALQVTAGPVSCGRSVGLRAERGLEEQGGAPARFPCGQKRELGGRRRRESFTCEPHLETL